MADGKWIRGLRPEMPLSYAAREVLLARLEVVRHYLPKATREAEQDPEYVHQLRVGTRRADAALRIFRSCLPGRVYREARARLRTIRRAAGAARDWDVFLEALTERLLDAASVEQPGLDFLIAYSLGQRQASQAFLALLDESQEGFEEFLNDTIARVRSPHHDGKPTLIEHARPMLHSLLTALKQTASGDLKDYAQLHQVRIAGKRLRYAMEIFADCFRPEFRDVEYPQVEEMQETLGRANDSHVAVARLIDLRERMKAHPHTWGRVRAGIEALLRFHQRRLPQERRRFMKWWETWRERDVEGLVCGARSEA